MRNEAEAQKLVPAVSLREIFTNPCLRLPLGIAVMMMLAQQFSGINAVSSTDIIGVTSVFFIKYLSLVDQFVRNLFLLTVQFCYR